MALDYLAYQQNVANPLQQAFAGYQAGLQMRQQQDKQAQLQQQRVEAAQMKADLASLVSIENPTPQDFQAVMLKWPTLAENLKTPYQQLTEQQAAAKRGNAFNIYAALDAGQTSTAKEILQRQYDAAVNSGNQMEADTAKSLLQQIDIDPKIARTTAGLYLASTMGVEKFGDTWTKLQSEQRERALLPGELAKQGADLGLTKAQINEATARTEKLGRETQKLALELKAMEEDPQAVEDPKKRFDMERSLAGDYLKRSTSLGASQRNLDIIQSSATDNSGAGDIALVTSFMKMLDPGSVVRETEFATAQNAGGLRATLEGTLTKLQGGQFLSESQRKTFVNLANKYMEAAEREDKRVRDDMGFIIKNYGLNEENVFGTRAGQEAPAQAEDETAATPSYMKYATQGGGQ